MIIQRSQFTLRFTLGILWFMGLSKYTHHNHFLAMKILSTVPFYPLPPEAPGLFIFLVGLL